ncbi:MAG: hypothetical protein KIT87_30250, partial [Anaerolineae bacterium]|nr:hypothetical protein [Anaerolineae bacterium]
GDWLVLGVGEPNVFHCIFLGHALTEQQALQGPGSPAARPLGPVTTLLAQAAPYLMRQKMTDRTADHALNVFDTYLEGDKLKVKGGVRMRLSKDGSNPPGGPAYFYGIRINLDRR